MIKQTIKYDDYNDVEQEDDFYFNLTKLEIMEMEIDFEGGLSNHIKKLTETTAGPEAYHLFKDIILKAYGKKTDDGKRFIKNDPETGRPLRDEFETSPAMAELIFSFLQDGNRAAEFVRGLLPSKMVAEVEAEAARQKAEDERKQQEAGTTTGGELTAVAPEPVETPERRVEEYSREELLALSDEEFNRLAGTDPMKMSQPVLQVAMQRKSQQ